MVRVRVRRSKGMGKRRRGRIRERIIKRQRMRIGRVGG